MLLKWLRLWVADDVVGDVVAAVGVDACVVVADVGDVGAVLAVGVVGGVLRVCWFCVIVGVG